jgi:signal transduction histidine kinase
VGVGDWVQSIVGVVSIVVSVLAAAVVLRLERRERRKERMAAHAVAEQKLTDEADRERRAICREQHKDDYLAANRTLTVLETIFRKVQSRPFTQTEFREAGMENATQAIQEIRSRVPGLADPLHFVWLAAIGVARVPFPDSREFKWGFGEDRNYQADRL